MNNDKVEQAVQQAKAAQPRNSSQSEPSETIGIPNGVQALADLASKHLQPQFNDALNAALLWGWAKSASDLSSAQKPEENAMGELTKVFIQTQVRTGNGVFASPTLTASSGYTLLSATNGNH